MSFNLLELSHFDEENLVIPRTVVKIKTSYWSDDRGIHIRKDLSFSKRKSVAYNLLEEDADQVGAENIVVRIINLDECEDGFYQVVTVNESRDWESGYIEDYDYKLIPYKDESDES